MQTWQNRSPGDLDDLLPAISCDPVDEAVQRGAAAFPEWSRMPLAERISRLCEAQKSIRDGQEDLARLIARETGKPLVEARGELGAVIAKFDLSISDAEQLITDRPVAEGPHPALVRHKAPGPAAVIAPFNFPIHLGHGAAVAYLLAGSPVLYKPSPLAAVTGADYGRLMSSALPPGVFQIVQGWGETGRDLCVHPSVRSVCFTGSIPVGTALAKELAADYSKSLALELGGKCAALIRADADLAQAAQDTALGACLTAGQRCNATSLVYLDESVLPEFLDQLAAALSRYQPGDPLDERTTLGPVVNATAIERYRKLTALDVGELVQPGATPGMVNGKSGHWVTPAVICCTDFARLSASPLYREESFCPILTIVPFKTDEDALRMHHSSPFGLTTSIYTRSRTHFESMGHQMNVGNLYWNLPTTFSPSTLPFGGFGISGNGKPGARSFIRYAVAEQAVQWKKEA